MNLPCLFNFSASPAGGGLKRLREFSRWCNAHGGAHFIIHESCMNLATSFPNNRYHCVTHSRFRRLFDDKKYLEPILKTVGDLDLYYAYGIPVYRRAARVNWFHLSNVIPFNVRRIPLPLIDYLKQPVLAWRYRRNLQNADIVSAESRASLRYLESAGPAHLVVSVNGSDDELSYHAKRAHQPETTDTAVVVGTYKYKAISDSWRIFQSLQSTRPNLKLTLIGVAQQVPREVREASGVTLTGVLPRSEVIRHLARASHYISTTTLENSYNAASEGVFLARESWVSDIPVHRELLEDETYGLVNFPGVRRSVLHVRRDSITTRQLRSWDQVISDVMERAGIDIP